MFDTTILETVRNMSAENEGTTRLRLVDPILFELDWKPEEIVAEWGNMGGFADYALMPEGHDIPICVIEAKKLGAPLDRAISQGVSYCIEKGIKYFSVTDGNEWRVYDIHKPVPLDDKMIARCIIRSNTDADVLATLFILWRDNMVCGKSTVIYKDTSSHPITQELESSSNSTNTVTHDLLGFKYQRGMKPTLLIYPNGQKKKVTSWVELFVSVANQIGAQVMLSGPTNYLVNTTPNHIHVPMRNPKQLNNGNYIECNMDPKMVIKSCEKLGAKGFKIQIS